MRKSRGVREYLSKKQSRHSYPPRSVLLIEEAIKDRHMPVQDLWLSSLLMLALRGAKTRYLLADTVAEFLTFPTIHTSLMLLWCLVNHKFIHLQMEDIRYVYTNIW